VGLRKAEMMGEENPEGGEEEVEEEGGEEEDSADFPHFIS